MKTQEPKVYCVKLKNIVGYLYVPNTHPKLAMISLGGAPSMGDDGRSKAATLAAKSGITVFRPDYIGTVRSDGKFSFRTSIETIYESLDFLQGKISAIDVLNNKPLPISLPKKIILSGGSFGGSIAPFMDLYKQTPIKDLLLVMPVTNWVTMNPPVYKGDETTEEFSNIMGIALKNVWRGYTSSEWPQIVRGEKKEFNPLDNTKMLSGKNVYIFHGTKDKSVSWKDSLNYYQKLKNENLVASVMFEKLVNHSHSSSASEYAMSKFVTLLKQKNQL